MPQPPHLAQYQGSKRLLANRIIACMPVKMGKLIEPFAGMAAVSIACACQNRCDQYYLNDVNEPLIQLLKEVIECPESIIKAYCKVWEEQYAFSGNHTGHFYHIREKFNAGDRNPAHMLYLLARCVKGSIRYGKNGNFNQSPDKRRHGTNPKKMTANILAISSLLKGRTHFSCEDYNKTYKFAAKGDLIYMDPPYQGVCANKDSRYLSGIDFDEFCDSLEFLNHAGIDYIISYDGACGNKTYGRELPDSLKCEKIILKAGKSSQQTLLGNSALTYESLYLSQSLGARVRKKTDFYSRAEKACLSFQTALDSN